MVNLPRHAARCGELGTYKSMSRWHAVRDSSYQRPCGKYGASGHARRMGSKMISDLEPDEA